MSTSTRTTVAVASLTTLVLVEVWRRRRAAALIASHTAVLDYWFGGDVSTLYDSRWFVPSGSASQRALDAEIRTRFGDILARAQRGELDAAWCASPHSLLALIVLLDQLSRHVHRADEKAVHANDGHALRLTRKLLARGWDASLSASQLVFALMPLRHQPTEERLREVLERTAPRLDENEASVQLLQRFRRHTKLRLLHLEGRGDPQDILERPDLEAELDQHGAPSEVLSATLHAFLHEHFGERIQPTAVTGTRVRRQPHRRARKQPQRTSQHERRLSPPARTTEGVEAASAAAVGFADASSTTATNATDVAVAAVVKAGSVDEADVASAPASLLVSLSGGVDSMVLVHMLLALRAAHGLRYSVGAVHINYSNRLESAAEAEYVRRWCEARGVRVWVRTMTEMQRATTNREEYERESRRIRFDAYRQALGEAGGSGVFFGHHEGDLHENVICNVFKGAQLLNVAGIAPASLVSGIVVYRPMLPHPKRLVYEYAHRYGVPYLKDTTPRWSTRGKLREGLLPLLREVYGEGFGAHLTSLAKDSAQCAALVQTHMLEPLWDAVRLSAAAAWVDVGAHTHMPLFFWREALRHICEQKLGVGLVKERAAQLLVERLQRPLHKQRDGWLALKRDTRTLLVGTRLILFAPHLFPGEHQGRVWVPRAHASEGTPLDAPPARAFAHIPPEAEPRAYRMGGWRVRLRAVSNSGDEGEEESATGGVASAGAAADLANEACVGSEPAALWQIARGRLVYALPRHDRYAVGSSTQPQVEPLEALRGEVWGALLAAFPQIVGVGPPRRGTVLVELECMHRDAAQAETDVP